MSAAASSAVRKFMVALVKRWTTSPASARDDPRPGKATGGFRDAAEGDFEAEGAELADVMGDLAADVALALVVVRAEIGIAHAGFG